MCIEHLYDECCSSCDHINYVDCDAGADAHGGDDDDVRCSMSLRVYDEWWRGGGGMIRAFATASQHQQIQNEWEDHRGGGEALGCARKKLKEAFP